MLVNILTNIYILRMFRFTPCLNLEEPLCGRPGLLILLF